MKNASTCHLIKAPDVNIDFWYNCFQLMVVTLHGQMKVCVQPHVVMAYKDKFGHVQTLSQGLEDLIAPDLAQVYRMLLVI